MLPSAEDKITARGVRKRSLPSLARKKYLNFETALVNEISVTVILCPKVKYPRPNIEVNPFNTRETDSLKQLCPYQISNSIRNNVSQKVLLSETAVRNLNIPTSGTYDLRPAVGRAVLNRDAVQNFSGFRETVIEPDHQGPFSGSVLPEPWTWRPYFCNSG